MDARTKKKQSDERERERDWLVHKFGLWWPQSFDVIQAEPLFILLTQEDKIKLCSQVR